MNKSLSLFTYTHSNCSDLWKPYFGSIDDNFPGVNSVVASNVVSCEFPNHTFQKYEDKHYCREISEIISNIDTDYFIYMQEDFFLYENVDVDSINRYVKFLEGSDVSFVRLIKCGVVSDIHVEEDLYWITDPNKAHIDHTTFSMQPTIWKKTDFVNLYKKASVFRFGECEIFAKCMNDLDMKGVYAYNGESKRKNSNHYDSSVFPYIATALAQRKWNTRQYPDELADFVNRYGIDLSVRGCLD